jgi:NADH-quinone oxidoreductase subunit I
MGYFGKLFSGIYNLIVGLKTTLKYLPGRAITIQYPKEKMEMFERSRGMVVLLSDQETGKLNCTACLLCAKTCPVAAITIEREQDPETKKRYPTKFEIDSLICCYCGMCEDVCNFDAIKLAPKYEFATTDKASLIHDMARLTELGRDVKYTPKKKRVAKKAAPKPAAPKPDAKAEKTVDDKAADTKAESTKPEPPADKPEEQE